MEILIEIYSFSLYVVWDMLCCICHTGHKCCMGQSLIQFLWEPDWVHNQNMC